MLSKDHFDGTTDAPSSRGAKRRSGPEAERRPSGSEEVDDRGYDGAGKPQRPTQCATGAQTGSPVTDLKLGINDAVHREGLSGGPPNAGSEFLENRKAVVKDSLITRSEAIVPDLWRIIALTNDTSDVPAQSAGTKCH
jgi:hypothetical protein